MKVKYSIEIPRVSTVITEELEIDDTALEGLGETERQTAIDAEVREAVAEIVSWGWIEIEPEKTDRRKRL